MSIQLYFQRTLILMGITFIMIQVPLIIDSGLILKLFGQNKKESFEASNMALISLPGYLCGYLTELFYRTLCAKNEIWPSIIIGGSNAICALLFQLLNFYLLHWNLIGIALASSIAMICSAISITLIFLAHDFVQDFSLFAPSWKALDSWWDIGVNYASNLILLVAKKFILELPLIVGGIIGDVELGAAKILRRYSKLLAVISLGFGTSCIARIGAAIGARSLPSLHVYTAATFIFFTIFLLIATILNICLRYPLAELTTTDQEVVELAASLTTLVAIVDFLKLFIIMTFLSIFRGAGSVVFSTVTTLACEYILGLTLGTYLAFTFELELLEYYGH